MAVRYEIIDQGAGGSISDLYDRILQHERARRATECLRFTMVGDWAIWDVIRWTNDLWASIRDLRRDGEPIAKPCGEEPMAGYRLLMGEGRIALDVTWQANPDRPSWAPIAVQIERVVPRWQYWELWLVRSATTSPGDLLGDIERMLRVALWVAGALVLGPPLLQFLTALAERRRS